MKDHKRPMKTKQYLEIALICLCVLAMVVGANSIAFSATALTVSASVSGGGGSVSPATQSIWPGDPATITLTPDSGYHVASITDNGNSITGPYGSTYTITNVQAAHNVVVTFSTGQYTVSASVSGGGGSVSPASQSVSYGGNATINITFQLRLPPGFYNG